MSKLSTLKENDEMFMKDLVRRIVVRQHFLNKKIGSEAIVINILDVLERLHVKK